jgi:methylmalonyl-CoA mutase, N-terminal domain
MPPPKARWCASLDSGWLHERAAENQSDDFCQQESGEQVIIGVTDHRDDISPFEVDGFMGVDDAYDVALGEIGDVYRSVFGDWGTPTQT